MRLKVPATSANLGPGFDTLGLAIRLKNEVIIKPSRFHSVNLKGEGANNSKLKDNNMFINIFNTFYHQIEDRDDKFNFEFVNKIPISRGLGSSSAIICSAIASAYAMHKKEISKDDLLNLALLYEKHPDNITPAIMGGFNVCAVQDNKVKYIRKNISKTVSAVVVIPNKAISTNSSRQTLPLSYSKKDTIHNISYSSLLTGSFLTNNWEMLKVASNDVIHQNYRMNKMPILFDIQKIALDNGALMSTLSGSGSSVFNLVYSADINKIKDVLKNNFPNFRVFGSLFDNFGITLDI